MGYNDTQLKGTPMFIPIRIYVNKELLKEKVEKIAPKVAATAITLAVLASTAVMVERFSRKSDGSHDLGI
jgi:hypothetical protein